MKKNGKRALPLLISLFLCILVFSSVFFLKLQPLGRLYTEKVMSLISSNDGEISISYSGIGRTFLSKITVNDVRVDFRNKKLLSADKIDLSFGLIDLIQFARGKSIPYLRVVVSKAELDFDQDTFDYLNSFKAEDAGNDSSEPVSFSSVLNQLSQKGTIVVFEDSKIKYSAQGYLFNLNPVNLSLVLDKGLTFKDLSFSVQAGKVNLPFIKDDVAFSDLKLIYDDSSTMSFTLSSVETPEFGYVKSLSAIVNLKDTEQIRGAVNVKGMDGYYDLYELNIGKADLSFTASSVDKTFEANASVPYLEFATDSTSLIGNNAVFNITGDSNSDINILGNIESAEAQTEYGDFSVQNIKLDINPFNDSFVTVKNIVSSYLPENNSVRLHLREGKELSGSIDLDGEFISEFSYSADESFSEIRASINNLEPEKYIKLLDEVFPIAKNYVSNETILNGHFYAFASLKGEQPDGKVTLNLAGNSLKFGKQKINCAMGFSSDFSDGTADFDDFFLTALGMRLSYSGVFNLQSMVPEGKLILQNAQTGSSLAYLNMVYDSKEHLYKFDGMAPAVSNYASLTGVLNLYEQGSISASSLLKTTLRDYPLFFEIDRNNMQFSLNGSGLSLESKVQDDRYMSVKGKMDNSVISVSDKVDVGASCTIDGLFDLSNNTFELGFNSFNVFISDILNFGFDLNINERNILLTNFKVGNRNTEIFFSGNAGASNFSFSKFINGNLSDFSAFVDLYRIGTEQYLKFYYYNSSFSSDIFVLTPLEIRAKAVGTLQSDAYANFQFGEFEFDAMYSDKKLSFFNQTGTIKGIDINEFDVNFDFIQRTMSGTLGILKVIDNRGGEIKQGAHIDIDAKLDSIRATALNLAGIEAKAEFNIAIKDAFLSDQYRIKDNDFVLEVDQNGLKLNGDLIDGYYEFRNKFIKLNINEQTNFGLSLKGYLGNSVDLVVDYLSFDAPYLNQIINYPYVNIGKGILKGNLLIKGRYNDPSLYGMLYSDVLDISLFWLPDQILSIKAPTFCLMDHTIQMVPATLIGYGVEKSSQFKCDMTAEFELNELHLEEASAGLEFTDGKAGFWIPTGYDETNVGLNISGDATGSLRLDYSYKENELVLTADVLSDNAIVTYRVPQMEDWAYEESSSGAYLKTKISLVTGKNVQFAYPDVNNPFVSLTINEGQIFKVSSNNRIHITEASGELTVKNGRIYYFSNDFTVTDGILYFSNEEESRQLIFKFDANAKLREYDSSGKPFDVYLRFNKSDLNNLSPIVETSSGISSSELLQIMGREVINSNAQQSTLRSFAAMAFKTNEVFSSLGLVSPGRNDFSITSAIQKSLNLDTINIRSQILENLLIGSISQDKIAKESSLLSKYFNGTTLYGGKYIGENWFLRASASLSSVSGSYMNRNTGYFMADDLVLNLEFSLDWTIPFGTLTLFTQPKELSVFSILDNIGFSVTKQIKF